MADDGVKESLKAPGSRGESTRGLTPTVFVGLVPGLLLLIALLSASSYYTAKQQILLGVQRELQILATQAGDDLSTFFGQRREDTLVIEDAPVLHDYLNNLDYGLTQEAETYRGELSTYFSSFAARSHVYTRIAFRGPTGRELAAGGPAAKAHASPELETFSAPLKSGEVRDGGILLPQQRDLTYAAGVFDSSGHYRGRVELTCDLAQVRQILDKVRVGSEGRAFLTGDSGVELLSNRPPFEHPLSMESDIHGTPWRVRLEARPEEFLKPLRYVENWITALSLFAGLMVILLTGYRIRTLARPIEAMAAGTRRIASGDLDFLFATPPISELRTLGDSFNEMTRSLKERSTQLESRIRQLTALREMEGAVIERRDEETVLRLCLHAAARGLGFDRTALYWVDKAKGEIVGRYTYGSEKAGLSEESFRARRVPLGAADILNDVVQRRVAVLIKAPQTDPRVDQSFVSEAKTPEFVMAPICGKDNVVGVLVADNAYTRRPLEDPAREGLMLFANAAGLALENATLVKSISESEARYRTVLDNSPVAVIGLSTEHWITTWNRGAEQIFGHTAAEIMGKPLSALLLPAAETEHRALLAQMLEKGSVQEFPVSGRAKSGKRLSLSLSWGGAFPSFWMNREWTVVIRDVTETQKLQEQLLRSEKLSAAGQMIASIAHELNNPLSAVVGFAALAADKAATPDLTEDLQQIHENATRCRKIIDNLLLFVRQGEVRKEPVRAEEVARAAVSMLEFKFRKTGVEARFDFPRSLPRIQADFQQIEQVFVNMINNGCDAMALQSGSRALSLRARAAGEFVRVEFADNGPGVPEEVRSRLFEPLFTTKPEGRGTGLGLVACKQIVESHGGSIGFKPGEDGGAVFWMELPVALARAPRERVKRPEAPRVSGKTILVVDDEPAVLKLLVRFLEAEGHHVTAAGDLRDAWEKASAPVWDLVVSDVLLHNMSGLDLQREWEKRTGRRPPPFLYITGDVMNEALQDEFSRLGIPMMYKPVDITEFQQLVRSLLAARAASE